MPASAPFLQPRIRGSLVAAAAVAWFAVATAGFAFVSPHGVEGDCEPVGSGHLEQLASEVADCCAGPDSGAGGGIAPQLPGLGEGDSGRGFLGARPASPMWSGDPSSVRFGQAVLTLGRQRREDRPFDMVLGSSTVSRRQASVHRLSHSGGSIVVEAELLDVGPRFSPPPEGFGSDLEEAKRLEEYAGKRGLELKAEWGLSPALSFNTSQARSRSNDRLGEQHGLTTTDTEHSLSLAVGSGGHLRAALTTHREEWDRWLGKQGRETYERRVEFDSPLDDAGASTFRFAMTSLDSATGAERERQRTAEAHLNAALSGRLRLTADWLSRAAGDGQEEMTKSVGAALQLAPGTEVSATLKRLSSGGNDTDETGLGLAAKIGCGSLKLEEKLTRGADGPVRSRTYGFDGGFGRGTARTNLKAEFSETRAQGTDGSFERAGALHLDRSFGSDLKLSLHHRGKTSGTGVEVAAEAETSWELSGELREWADFVASAGIGRNADGETFRRGRVSLSRGWGSARARVEHSSWQEGAGRGSVVNCGIDLPTGDLPDWATSISTAHQFSETAEFLVPEEPVWGRPEMPFSGYRVWVARRAGGEDQGRDTLGFAHRRVMAGRYQLLVAVEDGPQAADGGAEGGPLALRRHAVELGAAIREGLSVRCGYGVDTGMASPQERVDRAGFGVWGKLAGGEQIEVDVSHESGRWEGEARDRTSIALLYSKEVGDEHQVEVKFGYAWGEGVGDGRHRDSRLTFSYDKPL